MLKAFQVAGLTTALWYLADFFYNSESEKVKRAPYFSALSKFVRPPCCKQWPESIIDFMRCGDCNSDKDFGLIVFFWDNLLDDLRLGRLELCDPEKHLHLLIQNELVIDGWPILFEASWFGHKSSAIMHMRFKYMQKNGVSRSCLSPTETEVSSTNHHKYIKLEKIEEEKIPLDTWDTRVRYMVDYTDWLEPYEEKMAHYWTSIDATIMEEIEIEDTIKLTQKLLSEKSMNLSVLALTVFANPADWWIVDYCAKLRDEITYMYILYSDSLKFGAYLDPDRLKANTRTEATFTSLDNVITNLTSGSYPQTILETRDISDKYATWLWTRAELMKSHIEDIKGLSDMKDSVSYCRTQLQFTYWEAVMYKGGILKRYFIVMKNNRA